MNAARRFLIGLTAVIALALAPASSAWAADMELTPNFTECAPADYPGNCARTIGVAGTAFPPSTNIELYWMDPLYFLLAAGGPGATAQELSGTACREFGQGPLVTRPTPTGDPADVVTDGSGGFTTTIVGPPANAVYGANAVCAVWVSNAAYQGVGNQYTIYPF